VYWWVLIKNLRAWDMVEYARLQVRLPIENEAALKKINWQIYIVSIEEEMGTGGTTTCNCGD